MPSAPAATPEPASPFPFIGEHPANLHEGWGEAVRAPSLRA
ncbi:hypothetical protein ACWC4A_46615 [Streptomyces mirabilis]